MTSIKDDVSESVTGENVSPYGVERLLVLLDKSFDKIIGEVEDYAIIFLQPDGTISTWNKGAEKIKGYKSEEIIGKSFRLFYTREDKEAKLPEKLLGVAMKEGKANHEGWRIRKDGARFWGSVTITAIHSDDKKLQGFLKVTRDLTAKRISEDKLSQFIEELMLKNAELTKSEERYHRMVEEIQEYAIILLDKEGNIQDWNKGAQKLKGYTPEEIIGSNFRLFYTLEDREQDLPKRLLDSAREKGSIHQEGWRIRKNGERFWASVSITALHDQDEKVFGYCKITRDLTARKKQEDQWSNITEELRQKNEQLRESEERYHKMISEVQDYAIILLNPQGEIQNWNAGAEKITGYTASEVIGKSFTIFYGEEDSMKKFAGAMIREAVENGKASGEGWRLRKDGSRFWASVVVTALHDSENRIIGFSKVTRDLTQRKIADEELDRKTMALEQMNAELSSFAFVASHDLKEPLRKIRMYISRISENETLSEKSRGYMQRIIHSSSRMQHLIEDLLAFSKLSDDESQLEDVELGKIVEEVKTDLEETIGEKRAIIQYDALPVVRGASFQFHQLFLNLFSNALKFSNPDVLPVINVSHQIARNGKRRENIQTSEEFYHVISVADNGIGFESHQAEKIFDVFYRLHPKERFEGTGIGLAIVKKVVDNHKGTIVAEGKPGQGAAFHIYLPLTE
jgi:PAS domain S-box-containing protein